MRNERTKRWLEIGGSLAVVAAVALAALAATPTSNIPISQMPIATEALETAWFPIIQPYPGRLTNDNFRVAASNLFTRSRTLINATNITVNGTNVATVADLIWTNDQGRVRVRPELVPYFYTYPSNFYGDGWFALEPVFQVLGSGTNTLDTKDSSYLMFSMTNDPAEVIVELTAGYAMGQELLLMSYTNTVFDGRFTLPANSVVSGGGLVKLNNNQDWLGANGSALSLIWIEPDWWERGRWTAGTNVAEDGLWANVAGVLQPRGGQITNALLFTSGSADAATNTALTVDTVNVWTTDNSKLLDLRSVGTNVAYVTPSGSFESGRNVLWGFPSRDDILVGVHDASLGESSYAVIYTAAIDGNTETNYSDFGVTLNTGASPASSLFVASVATNLVSSFNILLQPDQNVGRIELMVTNGLVWKVDDNGGMYVGPNSYSLLGPNNNALSVFRDVSLGDLPSTGMNLYARMTAGQGIGVYDLAVSTNGSQLDVGWNNGPSAGRGVSLLADSDETLLAMNDLNGVARVNFAPSSLSASSAAVAHHIDTETTWTQGYLLGVRNNSTNLMSVRWDGGLVFGPGITNALFRSGTDFVFENDNLIGFSIRLRDTSGDAIYSANGSGSPVITSSIGGQPVYLSAGGNSDGLVVGSDSLQPGTETMAIGATSSNGAWVNQYFKGTLRQQGFNDGSGNITTLEVTHTGNAGNIEYKSAATGTQTFRPHVFMIGSTNVAKFDTTSAAGETRFWLYDEDNGTMERVTVGAADSGGVGFKLLRIPN